MRSGSGCASRSSSLCRIPDYAESTTLRQYRKGGEAAQFGIVLNLSVGDSEADPNRQDTLFQVQSEHLLSNLGRQPVLIVGKAAQTTIGKVKVRSSAFCKVLLTGGLCRIHSLVNLVQGQLYRPEPHCRALIRHSPGFGIATMPHAA
jgi:hypothetical protein